MIIKIVEIQNFQCYYGRGEENKFRFEKGVNIITGINGAGKSKLFNAIHWALFGNIFTKIGGESDWHDSTSLGISFISKRAKKEAQINDRVKAYVKLIIDVPSENDSIKEYQFLRSLECKKIAPDDLYEDKTWQISSPETLEISYKAENGETYFEDELKNEQIIDIIFPKQIRKYMWFQGEAIDKLLDFNNPKTLRSAIQSISYYPYYEKLKKIVQLSSNQLSSTIIKTQRSKQKSNEKYNNALANYEFYQKKIETLQDKLEVDEDNLRKIKDRLFKTEQDAKRYDNYTELQQKLHSLEKREQSATANIDRLNQEYRLSFVNKWMLKGIDALIKEADEILDTFTQVIKEESETKNPIPIQIPGEKYIQQMIDDHFCYICERSAQEGTPEYNAIKSRLSESSEQTHKKLEYKKLEFNYMSLRNEPTTILKDIQEIDIEIKEWDRKIQVQFEERMAVARDKKALSDEYDVNDLHKGASHSSRLASDIIFLTNEQKKFERLVEKHKQEIYHSKTALAESKKEMDKNNEDEEKSPEEEAQPYIDFLNEIMQELKDNALAELIENIQDKGNELYSKYLEESTSPGGYLALDKDTYQVQVLDDGERKDINQGHEAAAKMSVINAILYLSSQKIGKSYPLVADAPSSVFDVNNTKTYTEKISETFDQVIILSKDYSRKEDLKFVSSLPSVKKVYEIENKKIDPAGPEGEVNHRTTIKEIK